MRLKELYNVKFQEVLIIIIQKYCLIQKKLTLEKQTNREKELQMSHAAPKLVQC